MSTTGIGVVFRIVDLVVRSRALERTALSAVLLTLLTVPATVTADGGDTSVIHACVIPSGPIRIIGPNDLCRSSEVAVHWTIGTPSGPASVTVDCAAGQTITQALQNPGTPLTITVRGTCIENVRITRDDVTLRGEPGATVDGSSGPGANTITVLADRVAIEGLTVTGGRNGIEAAGAGRVSIQNCTVQNTGSNGIVFFQGSDGTVNACTIQNAVRFGIHIEGGSATITNSTISGNDTGINLSNNGGGRIGVDNVGQVAGNVITGNAREGIFLDLGASAVISGNTINNNTGTGVGLRSGASAMFRGNTISGNARGGISLELGASARILGNTINNNTGNGVRLGSGATAALVGNTISGNTFNPATLSAGVAVDGGSSASLSGNTISGNGGAGVLVVASTVNISADMITGNGPGHVGNQGGVFAFLGSSVSIRNATISQNTGRGVWLQTLSIGAISGGSIQNNTGFGIFLEMGAGLTLFFAPVTVTGNGAFDLVCSDAEASFTVGGSAGNLSLIGTISPACTGF